MELERPNKVDAIGSNFSSVEMFESQIKEFMKTNKLLPLVGAALLTTSIYVSGQPNISPESSARAAVREPVNYVIRVQWKEPGGITNHLQLLTAEGNFSLDTFLPERAKINDAEIPVTVSFKGDLRVLSPEKGQMKLFLGRTVPYVTSTYGSGKEKSSSYQQMQVGLSSTFTVTFGKPAMIQSDGKGEVSILVERTDN